MKLVSKAISPFNVDLDQGLWGDRSIWGAFDPSKFFTFYSESEKVADGTWNLVAQSVYMETFTPIHRDLLESEG